MHLGKQLNPQSYYMSEGESQVLLECIEVEKDLGVHVDNKLDFKHHVLAQTQKANRLLCLIRRSFTYLDKVSLPLIY